MSEFPVSVERGAFNLLKHCAQTNSGDRILIVHEDAGHAYYDNRITSEIAKAAETIGASVHFHEEPFNPEASRASDRLRDTIADADCTVFLARIGDQLRFSDLDRSNKAVMSYALDVDMLGGGFGQAHYHGFDVLKSLLNRLLATAENIHVTCANGTEFSGNNLQPAEPVYDVSVSRFPMVIPAPLSAEGFSGRVALPGFLTGTGSRFYEPYSLEYDGTLFGVFDGNMLVGFEGASEAVQQANEHYDFVSQKFGIERNFVHSWHAGMHPGCRFPAKASDNYQRWSGAAFGNPRILHFHTCGAYAPGEISWNVLDPTVCVDGVNVWENGRLYPDRVPGGADILDRYKCARMVFDNPAMEVGL